jgi:hypothetical protein
MTSASEDLILELETFRPLDSDRCPKCRTAGFVLKYWASSPDAEGLFAKCQSCGFAVTMPCAPAIKPED